MKLYNHIFVLKVLSPMILVLQSLNETPLHVKQAPETSEPSVSREYTPVPAEPSRSVFDGADTCIPIRYVCGYLHVF